MSTTTSSKTTRPGRSGREPNATMAPRRYFSKAGIHPFDEVEWKKILVKTKGVEGQMERELEFPEFWSENACRIAGTKYFRGRIGSPEWESSARQMLSRVAKTISGWGLKFGHLKEKEAQIFEDELTWILLHQRAAFNSPVWFNMGIDEKPQCSACFILAIEDNMNSILEWIRTEGLIFKRGSGAGINLSNLRGGKETLSAGGTASGPVSFMRGADSVAGMIASGGSTRRAAKMVVLNVDHPDVMRFVRAKADEEKKVRALIEGGYNMYDLNNEAWNSIQYQNANNSVRVTDEFMEAVERDEEWHTRYRVSGEIAETYRAKDLFRSIAEAAWECGDPGLQYDTTINRWHTCSNTGPITASNPCSEYMHLDNSACNLASINLLHYLKEDDTFDVEAFRHTVDILILAQEIIVDGSSYPTEKIGENAHRFRELGLGYANLGSLLMTLGIPYDSEEGRATAGAITALMHGEAYRNSALMAKRVGPFEGFEENREPQLRVLGMHRAALAHVRRDKVADPAILKAAEEVWDDVVALGAEHGVRNSQATVIAPTGTIALMMDCATTGIEPEFALVKTKFLVGGGTMKFVNTVVPHALAKLGYEPNEVEDIVSYVTEHGGVEGAPHMKREHFAVFDCAMRAPEGTRYIPWQGHVKMVASVQPFISGAISKTFNMPAEATVEDIMDAYTMGWKLGLKAFAVYRDGCKAAQPLMTGNLGQRTNKKKEGLKPTRHHLPPTRPSETHKFSIGGHEGYFTYSMFENGQPAELFVTMSKQGSILAGLLDAFAISVSIALQYGVPLKTLAKKFAHSRFEPSGFTENEDIPVATSITDYIFRYLALRCMSAQDLEDLGIQSAAQPKISDAVDSPATSDNSPSHSVIPASSSVIPAQAGIQQALPVKTSSNNTNATNGSKSVIYAGGVCKACGGMLIQTGTCKTCIQCGTSNGGC